jgi:tRNA pseudouridine13 synthase
VKARFLFMQFRWKESFEALPDFCREEKKLLRFLLKNGEDYRGACRRIAPEVLRIYYTACQSFVFNACLEERMGVASGDLGAFFEGDLAYLHSNGALFQVERADSLLDRSRRFEVSPSGPLFGKKMLLPAPGKQSRIEEACLERFGLRPTDFHHLEQRFRLGGGRRPFRVPASDLEWHVEGRDVVVSFFLPKGAFATSVLRELMKNEVVLPGLLESR